MNRRGFLFGGATLLAAPSIVHASNLMPISAMMPGHTRALVTAMIETKEIYAANILNQATLEELLLQMRQDHGSIQIRPTLILSPYG